MERIAYRRAWNMLTSRFVTRCPHRRGMFVGSHACFFCSHCKGRTEDSVKCSFSDFIAAGMGKVKYVYMDVMVNGEFQKTIRIKPTGWKIVGGSLVDSLTQEDIDREVRLQCPRAYGKRWNVEMNDMERHIYLLWGFYCGRFGKYRLKEPYRRYWKAAMVVIHAYIMVRYVLFPFFGWWNGVVSFINAIVWG